MLPENVLRYIFQSVAIIIEFHSFPIISNILYNINQILKFLLIGNLFQPYFQNILKIISIKMLYCQKLKKKNGYKIELLIINFFIADLFTPFQGKYFL